MGSWTRLPSPPWRADLAMTLRREEWNERLRNPFLVLPTNSDLLPRYSSSCKDATTPTTPHPEWGIKSAVTNRSSFFFFTNFLIVYWIDLWNLEAKSIDNNCIKFFWRTKTTFFFFYHQKFFYLLRTIDTAELQGLTAAFLTRCECSLLSCW